MTLKMRLIGILGIALSCLAIGGGGMRWFQAHQAAAHLQKADQLDTSQAQHGTQAVTHEQAAQALNPVLQEDDATDAGDDAAVDRSRAKVERLRASHPGPDPAPGSGPHAPEPVQAPVELAALDGAKDQLISDLTKDLTDTKKALADTRVQAAAFAAGDIERQAQVKDLQGEVLQLRAVIASTPRELHWGVSITGSTNQTLGGGVEYSRGIVFAGVDVVRRQLAGGQTTLEALGRVGFHF